MTILIIIVVLLIAYNIFTFLRQKVTATLLTQEELSKGYRKAQLVDVRELREFANGYIRGARNIPMTQLKQSINELRPDKPVYLYCQNTSRSFRAAQILKKNNFEDINILQGGFKKWTGKIDFKKSRI